jgi:hypothetical protein
MDPTKYVLRFGDPCVHYHMLLVPCVNLVFLALACIKSFLDHIGAMDSMVFEVAKLDGAAMICHAKSKKKDYLLVLNVSNCYEVP